MTTNSTRRTRPGPRPIARAKLLELNPGLVERFKLHIEIPEDPLFSCWHWLGAKTPDGYGYFHAKLRAASSRFQSRVPAHRIACALQHGVIPLGMEVLHDCHVRDCVSPMHVRYGSAKENRRTGDHYRNAMDGTPPEGNIFIDPRPLWLGWNLPEVVRMYEEFRSQPRPEAKWIFFDSHDPAKTPDDDSGRRGA